MVMELSKFISDFESVFKNTGPSDFTSETCFWELDEWSSLTALAIVSMIEEEYGVTLMGPELKGVKTIGQLYMVVMKKLTSC